MRHTRKLALAAFAGASLALISWKILYRPVQEVPFQEIDPPPPAKSQGEPMTGSLPPPLPVARQVARTPKAVQEADTPESELSGYLRDLENPDSESQELQAERLRKMREAPEKYLPELIQAFNELPEQSTYQKYKILFAMEQLNSAVAIPFLRDVATRQSANGSVPDPGEEAVRDKRQEVLIRMRAAGALSALAASGSLEARQALLDVIVQTSDRSVRSDAVRGYLATSRDLIADKDHVKALLPENEQRAFDMRSDIPLNSGITTPGNAIPNSNQPR